MSGQKGQVYKMKTIYDNSEISAELAGVEKEIRKSLLKIYKEYTKIAGSDSEVYLNLSISTTNDDTIVISANNAYFEDGSFDSKNPLRMWEEYEK